MIKRETHRQHFVTPARRIRGFGEDAASKVSEEKARKLALRHDRLVGPSEIPTSYRALLKNHVGGEMGSQQNGSRTPGLHSVTNSQIPQREKGSKGVSRRMMELRGGFEKRAGRAQKKKDRRQ